MPAGPLNLITDVTGLSVGHATDLALGSGVSVILFDEPATASGTVLGGAPGGRDVSLLDPSMTVQEVDAFVLSGGSAFGLDAAGGVQSGLRASGRGFAVGPVRVPIVPQAILMDLLNGGNKDWGLHAPYRDLGHEAYLNATKGAFPLGTVGAGTGATTANFKGGLGSASVVSSSGHTIAALVAVNAMGSVTVGDGPQFWAAPFEEGEEFGGFGQPDHVSVEDRGMRIKGRSVTATTIGAVVTDCTLSKAQLHRLSLSAHDGLARAVLPAHLPMDGDTLFSASTATRPSNGLADLLELCHLATLVTARAIARGVFEAVALPYPEALPAWRDRWGRVLP